MKILLLLILSGLFTITFAQKVYVTNPRGQLSMHPDADINVFITDNPNNADLIVYLTNNDYNLKDNRGIWKKVYDKSKADKTIFITPFIQQAELIIYITSDRRKAGWINDSKMYLFN